ncbi:MAG: hypothetical protein KME28_20350 [Pelatocladus maniniholoensis HA4357-MV3]|jgi:hypothetical protein|uniref:Uncharacterized protein n=1 Tax=Pelatocladus maniniholoensis HA4357-MV3 TaxID=1117104 RepID=A0A9E3LVE6_9NOST|nr:hypothetical protein [Pelatocladus maniniholoensis HA4357-MV3]
MSAIAHLPEDIRKEFEVKDDGRVVCKSWRALGRLCGVSHTVFTDMRKEAGRLPYKILVADSLPKSLEPLAGMDLRVVAEINEVTISCFVNYFAWESSALMTQLNQQH